MIVTLFRNTALSLVINSKLQKQYEVISLRFQPHSVYPKCTRTYMYVWGSWVFLIILLIMKTQRV